LTTGRTGKETVKLIGAFTIDGPILVPSYTILDLTEAEITLANTSNCNMIEALDTDHWEVIGGTLDANKANQASGHIVYSIDSTDFHIRDMTLIGAKERAVYINASAGYAAYGIIERNRIENPDVDGIWMNAVTNPVTHMHVLNNWIKDVGSYGIVISSNSLVQGNRLFDGGSSPAIYAGGFRTRVIGNLITVIDETYSTVNTHGIEVAGEEAVIANNSVWYAQRYGINVNNDDATIIGNSVNGQGRHGIYVAQTRCTVVGNIVNHNGAESNNTYDGIHIAAGGTYCVVSSNSLMCEGVIWNTRDGIRCLADHCDIIGNRVIYFKTNGITIDGGDHNNVIGNYLIENAVYGIVVDNDADYNVLRDNFTEGNTTGGIHVANANCDENVIKENRMNEAVKITDSGTNTIFASKPFQFTDVTGGTAAVQVTSPTGCYVFDAGGTAIAWGQLPSEVQQVIQLKIWAVAKDGPAAAGGQMHCEFTFNAGASNAAYNEAGKSWGVINKDSVEADYVVDDIVHWLLKDADTGDSEISALVAGDSFEILAIYEDAASPDGDTDAKFRVIEVEYV